MKSYCHCAVTSGTIYLKVVIKALSLDTSIYQQEIAHQTHKDKYIKMQTYYNNKTGLLGSGRNIYIKVIIFKWVQDLKERASYTYLRWTYFEHFWYFFLCFSIRNTISPKLFIIKSCILFYFLKLVNVWIHVFNHSNFIPFLQTKSYIDNAKGIKWKKQ